MPDKITTLKLVDNTNVFPNIKDENIPNTIMRIADLSNYVDQLKSINITGDIDSTTIASNIATFTNVHVDGNLFVNGIDDIVDKNGNKIINTGTFDPTSDNPAGQKTISERTIDLSKIVDSKGHPRFIEGTGTKASTDTGLTVTYNKWSLSGTHFMWVVAGTVAKDSVIGGQNAPDHNMWFLCTIPTWISNKIVPVFGERYIEFHNVSFVANDWTTQTKQFVFAKSGTTGLEFTIPYGAPDITIDNERHFRVQIDLLIDTD